MKKSILLSLMLSGVACAGFEQWTNKEGNTAELELINVSESDGEKSGVFKMRNGRTVTLKASDLAEADAQRLDEWQPAEATAESTAAGSGSVFDKYLDGNLVKLDGRSLKNHREEVRPQKYLIFYYTASWCGPCQAYTPSLVEFYNKNKNDNFEIVLISSDSSEKAMEEYAREKEMPWPQLDLGRDTQRFKKEFEHGVTGIPSVVVCDLDGEIVAKTRSIPQLEDLVK